MADELRRQVHRRRPIVLELESGTFIAKPLDWFARNDLGNEVLQQNVGLTNEAMKLAQDQETNAILIEAKLQENLSDPFKVLIKAYPDNKQEDFEGLSFDEIFELVHAALEVNHLERLWPLLDPNPIPPVRTGGEISSPGEIQTTGPKIESTEDFSSQDSIETPLSISPTEK